MSEEQQTREQVRAQVRAQVEAWRAVVDAVAAGDVPVPGYADARSREAAARSRALVADPRARELLLAIADGVLIPQDPAVAARRFQELAVPAAGVGLALGPDLGRTRLSRRAGGWAARLESVTARVSPRRTVEQVTTRLRAIVGTLAVGEELEEDLALLAEAGITADLTVLGLPGTGASSGEEYAARVRSLLVTRDDLRRVSVPLADLVPEVCGSVARARDAAGDGPGTRYDVEAAARLIASRTRPLLRAARETEPEVDVTFVAPDDAGHLAVAAASALGREAEFFHLPLSVAVPVAPRERAADLVRQLAALGEERLVGGGAPVGVRLAPVRDAVVAELAGRKLEDMGTGGMGTGGMGAGGAGGTGTSLASLLDRLVTPELAGALVVTIASDELADHALGRALAGSRPGARPPRAIVGPRCPPEVAWALGRDLDLAQEWGVVPAAGTPGGHDDPAPVATARAIARLVADASPPASIVGGHTPAAEPDPADPAVRTLALAPGEAPAPALAPPLDDLGVDALVDSCREAAREWAQRGAAARSAAVLRAADLLAHSEAQVFAAAGIGTSGTRTSDSTTSDSTPSNSSTEGSTTSDSSTEGSTTGAARLGVELAEAVDVARILARGAAELEGPRSEGARFLPDGLVLALIDPGAPLVSPAAALAAALGAGAACILVAPPHTAPLAQHVAHLMRQALADTGAPAGLVRVLVEEEPPVALVASDAVDVVLADDLRHAGDAEALRSTRPGGPRVLRPAQGPATMTVTPGADPEEAAADLLASAFARAGQAPGAVSVGILVGSAAGPGRLRDAIAAGATAIGPLRLAAPPSPELTRALTTLEAGERWLVEPRRLDESATLWTPGIKEGVSADSALATGRVAGPVLGLLAAASLADASAIAGRRPGPVAALHTLVEAEITAWCEACEIPTLALGRATPGAGARGYGAAAATGTALAAAGALGVDAVALLGSWRPGERAVAQDAPADPVRRALMDYTGVVRVQSERSWLRTAVGSDAWAWSHDLVRSRETSGLAAEDATLRRRPVTGWVRAGEGTRVVELVRVLLAAECVGASVRLSLCRSLSRELKEMDGLGEPARAGLRRLTPLVERVEDASSFAARVRSGSVSGRIRALGEDAHLLPGLLGGRDIDLAAAPVVAAGHQELLAHLRPQVLARSRHRAGRISRGD